MLLLLSVLLVACGTLEVGIEGTATPAGARPTALITTTTPDQGTKATVASPAAAQRTPTPSLYMDVWASYTHPVFAISLEHPADWHPVSGYGEPEMGEIRFAGITGFFHVNAMEGTNIDDITNREAGHHLQPYGSQPIIENLQVQGQEARLILPSADQAVGMDYQAALIVRYPQPVKIAGSTYGYFVLWADQTHIRTLAQTLRFASPALPAVTDTPSQPAVWEELPPGLVFSTFQGLWLVQADEQPLQIHDNPQTVLSPEGSRLLSYDPLSTTPAPGSSRPLPTVKPLPMAAVAAAGCIAGADQTVYVLEPEMSGWKIYEQ
jgi:hypothetical protein